MFSLFSWLLLNEFDSKSNYSAEMQPEQTSQAKGGFDWTQGAQSDAGVSLEELDPSSTSVHLTFKVI